MTNLRKKFWVEKFIHNVSPIVVLLLGLGMTGWAWFSTNQALKRDAQAQFKLKVTEAENALDFRVKTYINILQTSQGLFAASQSVERDEWKAFVEALQLPTLYHGIMGMGFIRAVPQSQKASYEQRVRQDTSVDPKGYPDFAIKPTGDRASYFVIEYIEPLSPNRPALGFDIISEPLRHTAALTARDTGQAAATGQITLVQDATQQPGLLILLPVYRHGMPHNTLEERRRALLGFIYTPLRVKDLIEEALPNINTKALELEIYSRNNLMYDSDRVQQFNRPNLQPPLHQVTTLDVAGETWQLYFSSDQVNQSLWMPTPILVLSGGMVISLLLFGIMRSLVTSRQRAFQIATRITAQLSKTNTELQTEIQERQQVEEVLKNITRLQNAILNSANYMIISTTVDGTILTFNRAAEQWLGYTAAEVIGKITPEIIHDHDEVVARSRELSVELGISIEPGFETFVAKARLGQSDEREWTYISKDGTRFPVLLSVTALYDAQNHLTGFLGIGNNIADRKQAQIALQESEERYRAIVEDQSELIVRFDLDGKLTFVNQAYCRYFGKPQEALIGTHFKPILVPEDRQKYDEHLDRLILEKVPATIEYRIILNEKMRYLQWSDRVIYDSQGKFHEFQAVGRDISDHKQMELKINESEERFRLAFNNAVIGMALISPQGHFLQVNNSLCEIVGYSKGELLATDFQSITHPDDLDTHLNYVAQMLNHEISTYQMEKRYIHKRGQIIWILLSVSLVRNRLGQPLYFISQIQNISQRKQAEARIAASLSEKDILLKEVHHRVKNNLQVIDSIFRHQCRRVKDPHITQILKDCQNRVGSMALLHEKLYQSKDLARIDMAEYIQNLVVNLYESYKINDTPPTLKIDVKPIFVELEIALACGLIINELVSNALKYAFHQERSGYLQISFSKNKKKNFILIIKDNGIGLPEDIDLDKTNSLGLKLVKSFVKQLQGTIELKRDNGTEFKITF